MVKILGLLLILAFALVATTEATAEDCTNDLNELVQECKKYLMFPAEPKIPPSDGCCGVIKKADVPCMCSKVTKEIGKVVCMEKVVYVANFCKRPLQPGSQCGSYKVPPLGQ